MGRVRAGSWVKPGLGVADAPLNMWEPLYICCLSQYWFSFPALGVGAAASGSSWGEVPALPRGSGSRAGPSHSIPVFDCLAHALSSQHSCFSALTLSLYR